MYSSELPTADKQDALIRALQDPDLYDHPVDHFSVIETHISWVILTGLFAYKIKKPVNLGFVDFSTLKKRSYFCAQELELNRRFAPDIYLEVIAIKGSRQQPRLTGDGTVIEYAVKMREFSQQQLLSSLARKQRLQVGHIDSMADIIANYHSGAEHAAHDTIFGIPDTILRWSQENIDQIESAVPQTQLMPQFDLLTTRYLHLHNSLQNTFKQRKTDGFIRRCHGDLHLGNMAIIKNSVTAFDCIEFNEELHWIDTMSDVAFVAMDLQARGYDAYSWRFINRYLQASGDYAGIAVLRYYFIYRALVRAKVEALGVQQKMTSSTDMKTQYQKALNYIKLAESVSIDCRPAVILMHGLSGSGKSTVALQLVESLGAVQIRSDVERKRLSGLHVYNKSSSNIGQGIYNPKVTQNTYNRLAELSQLIIRAGYSVIVDAAFLQQSQRDPFKQLAQREQAPFLIINCEAPVAVLETRIKQRSQKGADPSEATLDVLAHQIESQDILNDQELETSVSIGSSENGLTASQLELLMGKIGL